MNHRIAILSAAIGLVFVAILVWVFVGLSPSENTDGNEHLVNEDDTSLVSNSDKTNGKTGKTVDDNRTFRANGTTLRNRQTNGSNVLENEETLDGVEADTWDDPTNQEVLGSKKWMAKVSEQEAAKIQEVFEKAEAQKDKRIDRISRQNSIDAMKLAVGECLDELRETDPAATGRLIVEWTASANDDGRGVIEEVEIKTNVGLRIETFEQCVRSNDGLNFAGNPGEPLRVEYPFMFDVD